MQSRPKLIRIIEDFEKQLSDKEQLMIHKVNIGSPWFISIKFPIGETIGQIRGLIKDIYYKNTSNKVKAKLEIMGQVYDFKERLAQSQLSSGQLEETLHDLLLVLANEVLRTLCRELDLNLIRILVYKLANMRMVIKQEDDYWLRFGQRVQRGR